MKKEKIGLTDRQKKIIRALQGDIPISERPFADIARSVDISEEDLLETVREFKEKKAIRRFGATLKHQKVGYSANAMSAWNVSSDQVEALGKLLASLPQVTHCYERPPASDWPYNLYAMIHCKSVKKCEEIAKEIALETGIKDYVLLFSSKENKKASMQYF